MDSQIWRQLIEALDNVLSLQEAEIDSLDRVFVRGWRPKHAVPSLQLLVSEERLLEVGDVFVRFKLLHAH